LGGACCIRVKEEKSSRNHTREHLKNPNRRVNDNIKSNIKEIDSGDFIWLKVRVSGRLL